MVAPALDDIADDFGIESSIEEVFVMSIFLLAYAGEDHLQRHQFDSH